LTEYFLLSKISYRNKADLWLWAEKLKKVRIFGDRDAVGERLVAIEGWGYTGK
jgi:hypothetical protein